MAKLAYYASRLPGKEHWLETPEGFRVYTAVPICRTGYQEYLGREIKKHPDYDSAWNIGDEDVVPIYRPLEVVTAPATVASFEGKAVTDNHPPDDVALVLPENEREYTRGHVQNLRVGEVMEDGETPVLADLHVPNQDLNEKINGGVRDVSCGYVYGLARKEDGTLVMTSICGNHVAVVPKGRAGPEVSIRDAAIEGSTERIRQKPEITKKEERSPMKKGSILGRMLKAFAADAEPEEVEEAAKHLASKSARDAEPEDEDKDGKKEDKAASDADDPLAKVSRDVDFYWDSANQKAVPIRNSKGYSKRKAGDADEVHGAEEENNPSLMDHVMSMKDDIDAIKNHLGLNQKKDDEGASTGDADVLDLEGDEQGKTELPKQIGSANDSAISLLKLVKPLVAASKDKSLRDAYNAEVLRVKGKKTGDDENAYAVFAAAAVHDAASEEVDYKRFFNGVPYAEGQRRLEEHLAKKGKK